MLGVVLRELEGATPGLQDVPAIEVHEVCYVRVRVGLVLHVFASHPVFGLSWVIIFSNKLCRPHEVEFLELCQCTAR